MTHTCEEHKYLCLKIDQINLVYTEIVNAHILKFICQILEKLRSVSTILGILNSQAK